jgi:uncharacterized surface protein with fasciclin (FAS1) repeats
MLHVTALTAKSLIRVFDVAKAEADTELDAAEAELHELARNIESEDLKAQLERALNEVAEKDDEEMLEDLENSTDGWVDEHVAMMPAEHEELDESVRPIRLALVKVCQWRGKYSMYSPFSDSYASSPTPC